MRKVTVEQVIVHVEFLQLTKKKMPYKVELKKKNGPAIQQRAQQD